MQVSAGAEALQLFDSWVGCLGPCDYEKYILPYSKRVFDGLKNTGVPVINFSTGTSTMLDLVQKAGGDVLSFDWRIQMDTARALLGKDQPVQGNLDPASLIPDKSIFLEKNVLSILDIMKDNKFIFSVGHGLTPDCKINNVKKVIDIVKNYK